MNPKELLPHKPMFAPKSMFLTSAPTPSPFHGEETKGLRFQEFQPLGWRRTFFEYTNSLMGWTAILKHCASKRYCL